jgi:hypothetical protein
MKKALSTFIATLLLLTGPSGAFAALRAPVRVAPKAPVRIAPLGQLGASLNAPVLGMTLGSTLKTDGLMAALPTLPQVAAPMSLAPAALLQRGAALPAQTPATAVTQRAAQERRGVAARVAATQKTVQQAVAPTKATDASAETSYSAGHKIFSALGSASGGSVNAAAAPSARAHGIGRLQSSDRTPAPDMGDADFQVPQDREALLVLWEDLTAEQARVEDKRDRASYAVTAHNYHAITDERNVASHVRKAKAADARLVAIDAQLVQIKQHLAVVNNAINRLPAAGAGERDVHNERLQALAAKGGQQWRLPRAIRARQQGPEAKIQGLNESRWKRLYGYGFKVEQVIPKKDKKSKTAPKPVVEITGRWTEDPVHYEALGITLEIVAGELRAAKDGQALNERELLRWLEVAELAGANEPLIFEAVSTPEAIDAGTKLMAWGVPPHVLNHSLEVVTDPAGDGKSRISLSPDVIFYGYEEGRPVATPLGELLAQFLTRIDDPAALTKMELHALSLMLKMQAVPWAAYDEAATGRMLDELLVQFNSGKLIKPLINEPVGIDTDAEAIDLNAHLRTQFNALQQKLQQAVGAGKDLSTLTDLAQAARFAWTALNPAPDEDYGYRTVVHRDGLSFLKLTAWEHSKLIWQMLPLGETMLYLGMDEILREIVEKGIQGRPSIVADAGLADLTHPDMAKNVIDIDRDGGRIEVEELYSEIEDDEIEVDELVAEEENAGDAEDNSVHSHGTAVATPMALIAEALNSSVVSIDLPNFGGDEDLIPPGAHTEDYFYNKLKSALTAAIETWGARFINFSWGGGYDQRIHALIDQLNAETGAIFTNAAGNSGIGFSQQRTPSFADSILTIAGEDGLGGKVSFTSGGGFAQTQSGKLRFMPNVSAPAGYFAANSRVEKTEENEASSTIYMPGTNGDYVHMRGTSFSDPAYVSVLTALSAIAEHEAREVLGASIEGEVLDERIEALAPALWKLTAQALDDSAEMLPGVPSFYQGKGRIRPTAARALLRERVEALIGAAG